MHYPGKQMLDEVDIPYIFDDGKTIEIKYTSVIQS